MASPHDFEIPVVVLHAHRDVVAGLEARGAQQPAEPVGRSIEFGEGLGEAGPGHDEGEFVAVLFEMSTREHARAT